MYVLYELVQSASIHSNNQRRAMTIMTNHHAGIGSVDAHKDTAHAAIIATTGQPATDREFPTTQAGY